MPTPPALARRLGLADAVFIGLGSMIGAGVFSAFAPAAAVAGTGLLIGGAYLLLGLPFVRLARMAERRLSAGMVRARVR